MSEPKTCFVIMAIGDQVSHDVTVITQQKLKERYDALIKGSILKARPELEVVRADDVALPGTITTDIVTRIMHSDYVVADISFPNPNVFYELGMRHAARPGTVILKAKGSNKTPFDIAHLRYIEYEDTAQGLQNLSKTMAQAFALIDKEPGRPDSHFLEMAKLTGFHFPEYGKRKKNFKEALADLLMRPAAIKMIAKSAGADKVDTDLAAAEAMKEDPELVRGFLEIALLAAADTETTNKIANEALPLSPPVNSNANVSEPKKGGS